MKRAKKKTSMNVYIVNEVVIIYFLGVHKINYYSFNSNPYTLYIQDKATAPLPDNSLSI